ncbi:MAG: long-chain fatty acid--CoA ligase [Holophagales bacterium]|nr:long-chain fatty acid--CoA ligase [Holophagales bacterium]
MDALPARTLLDYFQFSARSGKPDLLVSKVNGSWTPVPAAEFGRKTRAFGIGLTTLGVDHDDRVAILSENRPEWPMTDFATLGIGGITVPIYTTYLAPQVEYILRDCSAKILVVSNAKELAKVMEVRSRCPALAYVVLVEGQVPNADGVLSFEAVVQRGEEALKQRPGAWDERVANVTPESHATIIYTSGTTGEPKGGVLSHGNFVSNVSTCSTFFDIYPTTVALSFLPLAHVFERMIDYVLFSRAATITYAESIEKLSENFGEVKPHTFASVPRVYDKIHARVFQNLESQSPTKQKIFNWAVGVGKERLKYVEKRRSVPGGLALKYRIADKLVFSKIRARLGGRFQFCMSGGAPLSKEVAEFFWGAGVEVYEGYGLTETSPVLTCNRTDAWKLGSVGKPIAGVTIRIAEDGEVLAKGPNIMRGYWNKPEETKKVFNAEGWFLTGDVGVVDREGFLTITDRKKELLINAYGKNIAPAPIEEALKHIRYIANVVLIGDKRKYLTALIVPNFERLDNWASANGVEFKNPTDLIRSPKVRALFRQAIEIVNGDEPSEKKIKDFAFLTTDFSIEGGELTPTLKVKRRVVAEKYKDMIDGLYEKAEMMDAAVDKGSDKMM